MNIHALKSGQTLRMLLVFVLVLMMSPWADANTAYAAETSSSTSAASAAQAQSTEKAAPVTASTAASTEAATTTTTATGSAEATTTPTASSTTTASTSSDVATVSSSSTSADAASSASSTAAKSFASADAGETSSTESKDAAAQSSSTSSESQNDSSPVITPQSTANYEISIVEMTEKGGSIAGSASWHSGTVGDTIDYQSYANAYSADPGFAYDASKSVWSSSATSGTVPCSAQNPPTIAADGSTVVQLYFIKPDVQTTYQVQYIKVATDGTTVLGTESVDVTAMSEDVIDYASLAKGKSYPGFTYDNDISGWTFSAFETVPTLLPFEIPPSVAFDGSTVLKFYYKENAAATYHVEYYEVNTDATVTPVADDSGTAAYGSYIDYAKYAASRSFPDYTYDSSLSAWTFSTYTDAGEDDVPCDLQEPTVAEDGSTIVKLYYTTNTAAYQVQYYELSTDGTATLMATDTGKGEIGSYVDYASYAAAKSFNGCTYDASKSAWRYSGFDPAHEPDCLCSDNGAMIAEDGSTVVKLYYAKDVANYTVNYYTVDTEGNNKHLVTTETGNGTPWVDTVDCDAWAKKHDILGYTYNAALSIWNSAELQQLLGVSDVVVTPDSPPLVLSDTIVDLYYVENAPTTFTVQYYRTTDPTGADATLVEEDTIQDQGPWNSWIDYQKYVDAKSYQGYTFNESLSRWTWSQMTLLDPHDCRFDENPPAIIEDGSTIVKLYYLANTDTGYTAEYYTVDEQGNTTLMDTVPMTGTTDTVIDYAACAAAKSYAGYAYDASKGCWTYSANTALDPTKTIPFSLNAPYVIPDGSTVVKFYYVAQPQTTAAFKVQYYKIGTDGTVTLVSTDAGTGTIGAYVDYAAYAKAMTIKGYTYDATKSAWTFSSFLANGEPDVLCSENGAMIAEDGTTVVKLYYVENKVTPTPTPTPAPTVTKTKTITKTVTNTETVTQTASALPDTSDSTPLLQIELLAAAASAMALGAFALRRYKLREEHQSDDCEL